MLVVSEPGWHLMQWEHVSKHSSHWPHCKLKESKLMFSPYSNDIEGGSILTIELFNLYKRLGNRYSMLHSVGCLSRCLFVWQSHKLSTSGTTHECMWERQLHPCSVHGRQRVKWRTWQKKNMMRLGMTGWIFEESDKWTLNLNQSSGEFMVFKDTLTWVLQHKLSQH